MNRTKQIPLLSKSQLVFAMCLLLCCSQIGQAKDEVLQGSVQENDALTRLSRPSNTNGTGQTNSLRIERASSNNGSPLNGLVDTNQFNGNLRSDSGSLGLIQPNEFKNLSAEKFDLGADRGSKELMIAWERWYKQLSGAVYSRWSQVADISGHAVVRITVTNNRVLTAKMVQSSGSAEFDRGLLSAIMSLDGNPGLTFPAQSERKMVSLESDYIAGTNIEPGYSWIKNDYEKINESY